jgi:hypothetical protein
MGYKVVINKCYGGFGVSEKGVAWLLANGASPEKVRVQDSGLTDSKWVYTVCTLERHDPLLVKMVETLGSEAASGDHAALEVRELEQPLYRIDEYDGNENIEEPKHVRWDDASVLEG